MSLPWFTAEASLSSVFAPSPFLTRESSSPDSRTGVVFAADSQTCNCNCGGGSGGTGTGGPPPPGVCSCSSVLGIGCSVSSNSCNPGFVPRCDCGLIGNSCQCVPGGA